MAEYFNSYSRYYNLFYKQKDYSAEVAYIKQRISKYSPGAVSILEYGSGSGGHGLVLKELGFDVFGLEQSAEMVSIARSKGLNCKVADISNYQLEQRFDVVLALFHVICYLTTNMGLISAFQQAAKQLKPGGIFLFDVWYTPAVYHQLPEYRIKEVENNDIAVLRTATPTLHYNQNVVDVNYDITVTEKLSGHKEKFKECHPMRHFSIPEVDLLARFTGFELVLSEEFLTGMTPSQNTWGVCFLLKKI